MAEVAPLATAHAHARKAAEATEQADLARAGDEHQHAATNYARTARASSDSEALRVLKLLEEQHLKLAELIKSPDLYGQTDRTDHSGTTTSKDAALAVSRHDFANAKNQAATSSSSKPGLTTTALAAARLGSQARDSSPSLAREIASRRGIPSSNRNPPSAAAQARARQLSPESLRRSRPSSAPKIPPSVVDSQNLQRAERSAKKLEDDDGFTKFYSNLTTGTMSKLSSVLAYAGLPLTADDVQIDQSKQNLDKRTVRAHNDPDVKKIYSKAALDAIEDEHRKRGAQGGVFGPAESFYVVQTGGGTYSYADIAKAQQQQLGGIDEDDEEAFVDAREAQAPSSPRHSRLSSKQRNAFGKSRTHEELELENSTLKVTLEQLATRLAEFEAHAQDASMAALTQSMASLHAQTPPGRPDPAVFDRLKQLERQLEEQAEERQKLQTLAAKQDRSLKQYKAKWEDIKKSAKEKEKAKREKSEAEAQNLPAALAEDSEFTQG
ncbi:hypothetical protein CLAFUW4_05585 [Fulvia fulva]|uniref:Uncharacterized protein n=1 Tax=Passalora fulva TaxID=5499 RepID=A0A9Q8P8N9_PASFU|nr:uncharacterized protein CLAFUR5_05727 [Fulvia fulva]KAK4623668.1 hypothetical protein CLAFUR4_05579 [Fulvia fulva]KAK4625170.1 hypothetical protein CLAFUR0_05588 [Fulvia fulva]UJO17323.1 hypothetical protein CLAFUR5_05727 [Fulvia fulva]WPV14621.1 hypothetical protein CLAFUW4_05585 [Fulvia fulva]WPV29384.1 hypothetical protein CLAFUW7_05583 [Fulvia fulva]